MLIPFLNAGEMLLAKEVADPATIDLTWRLGIGSPLGPFQILDIVGLNTALNIVSNNPRSQEPSSIPCKIKAILEKDVAEGKIGVNAGKGFISINKLHFIKKEYKIKKSLHNSIELKFGDCKIFCVN